jgi:tRNA-dihydrouridine synthase B
MSINIGPIVIDDPVMLAPMSGVSDQPFRALARDCGAGLVFSEMIASDAMIRAVREEVRKLSTDCAEEFPMAVQLAGWDPAVMAEAARLNADRGAAIIDINMGCPAKKVVGKLAGSALMREEGLAGRIIEAVVRAVDVPVTLKMRLGWDDGSRNAPRLARIAEEAGVAMITVHGRTRCQMYEGEADWAAIRAVKDAVGVPVIANGDVASPEQAVECLAVSGADGVMIGRGACGRPWLLAQASAHLRGLPVPAEPSLAERKRILMRHLDDMLVHYGTQHGIRIARKHVGWYAGGIANSNGFRAAVNSTMDPAAVFGALHSFFDPLIEREAA